MTTQLSLYNDALLLVGERFLASLTEQREPRRLLDQVWASNGVQNCLEQGQWFFAMRTVQIDADPDIQPTFGYRQVFTKPDDWVLTAGVCSDEYFRVPLTAYTDEAGQWYADLQTIYVRYVSNDVNYGMNFANWPDSFREFVAAHLASRIILKITNSDEGEKNMLTLRERLLKLAKNRCAMAEPSSFTAQGTWSRSRMRWNNNRDGGNPDTSGSLIG